MRVAAWAVAMDGGEGGGGEVMHGSDALRVKVLAVMVAAWVAAAREAVVMVAEAKGVVRYEGEASEQTVFTE